MLNDLEIINGELSPEFDYLNNIYSVTVDSNVTELVMEYSASEGFIVNVIDNKDLNAGENEVYLQVIKDDVINTYTLLVYKESSEPVFNYEYVPEPVEVDKKLPEYAAPLIVGSCILIILIFALLLFKHKKK